MRVEMMIITFDQDNRIAVLELQVAPAKFLVTSPLV